MGETVDYYFASRSPWSWLGHERFAAIAERHGARIAVKPVDYGVIFPQSGGLALAKRAAAAGLSAGRTGSLEGFSRCAAER